MNPQDTNASNPRQQVVERVRTAVNVLVTVSNNPSVDQLSAAIGFTLMLNKLGKHATAVFSGEVPSTIEFLKPEATIEKTTDSLRDFIVSLDKTKADKLRYKVEENVVKIFITPYRSSITEKDLNFSQGDFNVDAVIALGVGDQRQLDQAITSHGRILHDATVVTVSAGPLGSSLGVINWQDASAASLCEMLVGVGEALQPNILDAQVATAFLTGLVAQTDRFSNEKTTPKVMSLAAQLMAAGANQQLIASELEQATEVPLHTPAQNTAVPVPANSTDDGSLKIEHTNDEVPAEEPETKEHEPEQIAIDEHGNIKVPEEKAEEPKHETESKHRLLPSSKEDSNDGGEEPEEHPFTATLGDQKEEEPASSDPLTLPSVQPSYNPSQFSHTTIREIEKTVDSKHIAHDPTSTLHEIEAVLDSPHIEETNPQVGNQALGAQPAPAEPAQAQEGARDAVSSAYAAMPYDANRPAPLEVLNASTFNVPQPVTVVTPTEPPTSDPVLSSLGLSNDSSELPPQQPVLPPLPEQLADIQVQSQPLVITPTNPDPSGQAPPPAPPPMTPML